MHSITPGLLTSSPLIHLLSQIRVERRCGEGSGGSMVRSVLYTVLYYTVLYYTVLYCTVLYCILYCMVRSRNASVADSRKSPKNGGSSGSFKESGWQCLKYLVYRLRLLIIFIRGQQSKKVWPKHQEDCPGG